MSKMGNHIIDLMERGLWEPEDHPEPDFPEAQ